MIPTLPSNKKESQCDLKVLQNHQHFLKGRKYAFPTPHTHTKGTIKVSVPSKGCEIRVAIVKVEMADVISLRRRLTQHYEA